MDNKFYQFYTNNKANAYQNSKKLKTYKSPIKKTNILINYNNKKALDKSD